MLPACKKPGSISITLRINGDVFTKPAYLFYKPFDISFYKNEDPAPSHSCIEAQGDYLIQNLPEGGYYVWVEAKVDTNDTYYSNGFFEVGVIAGRTSILDLTLIPGGSISGQFLQSDGQPLSSKGENEWVMLVGILNYIIDVAPNVTFSMNNILPGKYFIYSNTVQTKPPTAIIIESGKETIYDFYVSSDY